MIPQDIPSIFRAVVARAAQIYGNPIYFDYGHYREVTGNLNAKDMSETQQSMKYPIVWLVMDFEEDHGKRLDVYASIKPNVVIAVDTDPNYTMDERWDTSFKPKLYPIYGALLQAISESADFRMPPVASIEHTKIDRPYWGVRNAIGDSERNYFNDHVDAIQLIGIELDIRRKIC